MDVSIRPPWLGWVGLGWCGSWLQGAEGAQKNSPQSGHLTISTGYIRRSTCF